MAAHHANKCPYCYDPLKKKSPGEKRRHMERHLNGSPQWSRCRACSLVFRYLHGAEDHLNHRLCRKVEHRPLPPMRMLHDPPATLNLGAYPSGSDTESHRGTVSSSMGPPCTVPDAWTPFTTHQPSTHEATPQSPFDSSVFPIRNGTVLLPSPRPGSQSQPGSIPISWPEDRSVSE